MKLTVIMVSMLLLYTTHGLQCGKSNTISIAWFVSPPLTIIQSNSISKKGNGSRFSGSFDNITKELIKQCCQPAGRVVYRNYRTEKNLMSRMNNRHTFMIPITWSHSLTSVGVPDNLRYLPVVETPG